MSELMKVGKWTRVTGTDRDKLREQVRDLYAEGQSVRSIAAATERSYGAVYRLLEESEVTMRPRGNPKISNA